MKKFSYIICSILGLLAAATSCNSPMDENPTFNKPTKFVLNTPATASQYYDLSLYGGEGTINFTCSQPDYGFAAAATYTMEMALTEDFSDETKVYAIETETDINKCDFDIPASKVAEGICKLRGITTEEAYTEEEANMVHKVFFRAKASVVGYDDSVIASNVVALERVKGYFAIKLPGYIYLVGDPEGWTGPTAANKEHYDDWRLFESTEAIGSKIYTGVFDIPAGKAMFRFYTALTGWDADSYGIQADDNPVDIALDGDGIYGGDIVKGKGSYNIPDWEGGNLKITVDLNSMKVKFEAGGIDYSGKKFIYLVGAPSGWTAPLEENASLYEDWKLYDMEDNGIYTRTFDIPAEKFQFRFYTALTGWDADSYGSQVEDAGLDIAFEDGVYAGEAMAGKGSWSIPAWAGGKVAITVDTNENMVIFEQK